MTRFVITFLAGVAMGVGLGRVVFRPVVPDHIYEITRSTSLTGPDGTKLGQLSTGVAVISHLEIDPDEDIGWWGYVPVRFGTMDEAQRIVRSAGSNTRPSRSGPMLNARPVEEGDSSGFADWPATDNN